MSMDKRAGTCKGMPTVCRRADDEPAGARQHRECVHAQPVLEGRAEGHRGGVPRKQHEVRGPLESRQIRLLSGALRCPGCPLQALCAAAPTAAVSSTLIDWAESQHPLSVCCHIP